MAKNTDIEKKQTPGVLAPTHDYGDLGVTGFENQSNDDMSIPFIGILQSLSPEVTEGDPKYIEGAKVGQLINSVTLKLFDADKGVNIVPVLTQHLFVEWVPRASGGGFVARHELSSPVVAAARASGQDFNKLKTPEGNELQETFYLYALLLDSPDAVEFDTPVVIAFTSTKIKVYKRIMTQLRTVKGNPPLFAHRLRVKSKAEKNKQGQPYRNFDVSPACGTVAESMIDPKGPQAGLLAAAIELHRAVSSGALKAANENRDSGAGEPDGAEVPFS